MTWTISAMAHNDCYPQGSAKFNLVRIMVTYTHEVVLKVSQLNHWNKGYLENSGEVIQARREECVEVRVSLYIYVRLKEYAYKIISRS